MLDAQAELQQLQTNPGLRVVAKEAQEQISRLMQTFAREIDTVSDRRAVQRHLQRIGLKVHIDGQGKRLGLQISDGPIYWKPLDGFARRLALEEGMINPSFVQEYPDGSIRVSLTELTKPQQDAVGWFVIVDGCRIDLSEEEAEFRLSELWLG